VPKVSYSLGLAVAEASTDVLVACEQLLAGFLPSLKIVCAKLESKLES